MFKVSIIWLVVGLLILALNGITTISIPMLILGSITYLCGSLLMIASFVIIEIKKELK